MCKYKPPINQRLNILYSDNVLLVVDKPSGLLSVPGRGKDKQDCLISRLNDKYPDALIVHRLDMETSGVMLLARSKLIHRQLSLLFQERKVQKRYVAIVDGLMHDAAGVVDLPLICDWPNRPRQVVDRENGKPSLTRFKVLMSNIEMATTRIELEPETGRSHQLRVHMQSLGNPILGDRLYANTQQQAKASRLLLHALSLKFDHPVSAKPMYFIADTPF